VVLSKLWPAAQAVQLTKLMDPVPLDLPLGHWRQEREAGRGWYCPLPQFRQSQVPFVSLTAGNSAEPAEQFLESHLMNTDHFDTSSLASSVVIGLERSTGTDPNFQHWASSLDNS
jgi:hypothetical protein